MVIPLEVSMMYGLALIEMTHVAEQEHLRGAMMAQVRAQARRERRRLLGPGRTARAWTAFWAPRDFVLMPRPPAGDRNSTDLTPCTDC
jgi:hypothetical protein